MTEERDPELSRHYRELEPLEPPPELDRKILDAALVRSEGRHRWYYGLAAAAVLVFAVALTLHMERERPDPEAGPPLRLERELRGEIKPVPPPESKPSAKPETPPRVAFAPDPRSTPEPAGGAASRSARADAAGSVQEPIAAERAAADAAAKQTQIQAESRARRETSVAAQRYAATPAAATAGAPAAAPENPERWLERIAELRSRGRHADADRELVAFRRAYPDYRFSDLMRERVEGTPIPSR